MTNPVLNQNGVQLINQGQSFSKHIQENNYNYSKNQDNWRG